MKVLAFDIGGTNCRMALARVEGQVLCLERKAQVSTDSVRTVRDLYCAAQNLWGQEMQGAAACGLAVAGPVFSWGARLSNADLVINRADLEDCLGMPVNLCNDFAAVAYALETKAGKGAEHCHGGAPDQTRVRAVVGAGTGFGCGLLLPSGVYVPSEGGHMTFPFEPEEESFAAFLRQSLHWSQLTADNVLSGRGLELLAFHVTGRVCSPKEAGERYLQEEDNEVARLYIRLFARTCRNWALATLCLGGLWIAGSLAMCNRQIVRSELFAREFVQGVHADLVARVPILLFDDADYGLWGAARAGQRGLYERSTW